MTDYTWLEQYFDESNRPTDRTVVVLTVSLIDESLTELLKMHLKPALAKRDVEDGLFGFSRPVADISSKIELAYRLGVIDKTITNTLKKLARLRNIAAHRSEGFCLTKGKVKDQMRSLIEASPKQGADSSMPEIWLKTFTASFVGVAKTVIDNMNAEGADPAYKRYGAIEVCGDGIFGRNFAEKKHGMSIWDKQ